MKTFVYLFVVWISVQLFIIWLAWAYAQYNIINWKQKHCVSKEEYPIVFITSVAVPLLYFTEWPYVITENCSNE